MPLGSCRPTMIEAVVARAPDADQKPNALMIVGGMDSVGGMYAAETASTFIAVPRVCSLDHVHFISRDLPALGLMIAWSFCRNSRDRSAFYKPKYSTTPTDV